MTGFRHQLHLLEFEQHHQDAQLIQFQPQVEKPLYRSFLVSAVFDTLPQDESFAAKDRAASHRGDR